MCVFFLCPHVPLSTCFSTKKDFEKKSNERTESQRLSHIRTSTFFLEYVYSYAVMFGLLLLIAAATLSCTIILLLTAANYRLCEIEHLLKLWLT